MKKNFLILILFLLAMPVIAEVGFSDLNLSSDNDLLFSISCNAPGNGLYNTLFLSNLDSTELEQLTFFPEKAVYLEETNQLQLFNRYGMFRSDNFLKGMFLVSDFPSFLSGDYVYAGKVLPFSSSPDGKYIIYARQESSTRVNLVLSNIETGVNTILSSHIELSFDSLPVRWSDDSQFLVYSRDGQLFYFSIDQLVNNRIIAENFRYFGDGNISSVLWSGDKLYFAVDNFIYHLNKSEFFTRSLYGGVFSPGTITGKIPYNFDPNTDRFWISPRGNKIMVCRDGRSLFQSTLNVYDYNVAAQAMPYLLLPGDSRVIKLLWTQSDTVILQTGNAFNKETGNNIYRLIKTENVSYFAQTDELGVKDIVLSKDQSKLAIITSDKIIIKNPETWVTITSFDIDDSIMAFWKDSNNLIVVGEHVSEVINITNLSYEIICYSQPGEVSFNSDNNQPIMRMGENTSLFNGSIWEETTAFSAESVKTFSDSYRVFLEETPAAIYSNRIMVRKVAGYGTYPLINRVQPSYDVFPEEEEPSDGFVFTHGSRIRGREISLVFDAALSSEGLTTILNILSEYDIRATFFINGDFMRRFPGAVIAITEAGHETGSLFNSYFDMTDIRYQIDTDFLVRGLARNEDDFYRLTGKELIPFWHAPFYYVNTSIIEATQQMNYAYIGHDVDSLDWVPYYSGGSLYMSSVDLVEKILNEKKPGSIIPIRVGSDEGYREDYLYDSLDILINNLLERGYSFVPVSVLRENSY